MNLSREISGLVPGLNKKKPAYGNTGLNLNLQKIVPLITQNCTFTRTEKSSDWWQLLFLCFYVSLSLFLLSLFLHLSYRFNGLLVLVVLDQHCLRPQLFHLPNSVQCTAVKSTV